MTEQIIRAFGGKPLIRLGGGEVTVGELLRDDPPEYCNDFKREIYEEAYEEFADRQAEETIRFSRNTCVELSKILICPDAARMPEIVPVPYFFRYDDLVTDEEMCWYLNFADPFMFTAYGSDLFAQDEIQTLEHPMLPALMLHLAGMGDRELRPLTAEGGQATPWIFENVPRWIEVNTTPINERGEKCSIYGNAFADAEYSLLRQAITVNSDPAARSNIIAMAAPYPDGGAYKPHQICQLLSTVLAGFFPAVEAGTGKNTVIHTGRWGAGAFGGSEELALCVQIVGGMLCGVTKLYFHAVSAMCLKNALDTAKAIASASTYAEQIVEKLLARGYCWGFSDGN